MSNDPCLDAAYAEWGTQNLSAAQRKRLHRTSTVGGGTPNKATLALRRAKRQPRALAPGRGTPKDAADHLRAAGSQRLAASTATSSSEKALIGRQ